MSIFGQKHRVGIALAPDADLWNGDSATDVISMADHDHITFIVTEGVGTTGTTTLTVESCDDVTPTTTTAIAFKYMVSTTLDTYGDLTAATTAGFATTAGSNCQYLIEVDASDLSGTDKYVRVQTTELVDAAVDASIIYILSEGRQVGDGSTVRTALT